MAVTDDMPVPPEEGLPDGFQVQIDPTCMRGPELRDLIGGSPTRRVRLSDAALGLTSAEGRIEVRDPGTRELARRLLDTGIAHPRPMFGPSAAEVTVIIPVRDDAAGVQRLVDRLGGLRVIVVDDGSRIPIEITGDGVEVLRLPENRGPAAARNAGAARAETEVLVFLDADVIPVGDWLTMLLGHLSDPGVALVAPRIVGYRPGRSLVSRYANGYSSLDLGPRESPVVPGTRVAYVPSAAIVVRRSAFPGFDEDLRVAEDVDLCWRLHAAGWRLRYDPVAKVAHDHRESLGALLDRRRYYGTGAAELAHRHGGRAAPVVMSVPMLVAVAALLTRTVPGTVVAASILAWLSRKLGRRLAGMPRSSLVAAELTCRGAGFGLLQTAGAMWRHYWPVSLLLMLASRRYRRLALQVGAAEAVVAWVRHRISDGPQPIGPAGFLLLHRLDDLAYGTGLWQGVLSRRDPGALRPALTR